MIQAPNFADLDWLLHGFGLRDSEYPEGLTLIHQVHSAIVLDATGKRGELAGEGDALISRQPGVTVGIRTADCVPVLLVDPVARVVAAIHAGWRGTAENISGQAVEALVAACGTHPEHLRAAVGPSIGPCCYEVGPEVARHFGTASSQKTALDLKQVNEDQLRASGVANIWKSAECTFCAQNRFYSFRRERAQAGRMISFIGF